MDNHELASPIEQSKSIIIGEHKVADGEEISCGVSKFKVQENGLPLGEAGGTSHDGNMPLYVWVVGIIVLKLRVVTGMVDEIQLGQPNCGTVT